MKLTDLSSHTSEWFNGSGPVADVVISSRIRLARNLAGFEFLTKCSQKQKAEILKILKDVLMALQPGRGLGSDSTTDIDSGDKTFYFSVHKASALDKDFLVERHLISRHHAGGKGPRGAIIAQNELFTAMINEEDHLRIQVFKPGLQLEKCWERINDIDDQIEQKVDYAFNLRYGYLTACPTNIGTGIRVSVMLHLPGLKMTGQIEKFINAARDMNLAVRGLYGEGTEAAGDFYQLSNQATIGISEEDIISGFTNNIIPKIIRYENLAREQLLVNHPEILEDKIYRALGILHNTRLMSSREAMSLLSRLRMGINIRKIKDISISTVNELFMLTQPAHLQLNFGEELTPVRRDVLRAEIIRSRLSQN